ncbi:MAG: major capsid protein [Methylococcaceae bacterium]
MFKKISGFVSAVAVTSVLTAGSAFAAIDTGAFDEAKTDVATVGGAALGVIIAAIAFKYIRKAL